MLAKFGTNAAMWSMNLVQVTESISGSVVPLAMFYDLYDTFGIVLLLFG